MSDKIIFFPKNINSSAQDSRKTTATEIEAASKQISTLMAEIAKLEVDFVKETDTVLAAFINSFEANRIILLLSTVKPYVYLYWECISAKLKQDFLRQTFRDIKDLPVEKISDFLEITYLLQINKQEAIEVLSRTSLNLSGDESLFNAYNLKNNYMKDILFNRAYFSLNDRVNSILNACKTPSDTYVIKYGNLFLNTERNGDISPCANCGSGESRALGLFMEDMQYIDSYILDIKTNSGVILPSKQALRKDNGYSSLDKNVYGENVFITRYRVVNGSLFEKIRIKNTGKQKIFAEITVSCNIRDIFEVRSKAFCIDKKTECDCSSGECSAINIHFGNRFSSMNSYGLKIHAQESSTQGISAFIKPKSNQDCSFKYVVEVLPNSRKDLSLVFQPHLNGKPYSDVLNINEALNLIKSNPMLNLPKIKLSGAVPNMQKTMNRCTQDLNMLVNKLTVDGKVYKYISAGLPRYSALFGRDSLITALQILPLNPDIARDTLELLALYQGKSFEERHAKELSEIKNTNWSEQIKNSAIQGIKKLYHQREEEPGKILHELRIGEFARTGVIPHSPYYGTVDATPLWLVLFFDYYFYTKDTAFLQKYMPNAEECIKWIEANMINGYLRFSGTDGSNISIKNQGWKDAGNSIKHIIGQQGNLADPPRPIALAEVQSYVYRAFVSVSMLYFELDNRVQAQSYRNKADELKKRFNEDFWLEDEQFYSMALDRYNFPVESITSNIGHCLAMGIIDERKAGLVENRLMSTEMFTGRGIRTLGNKSPAYDPLSYHNGSVWVHDSAFAVIGMSHDSISKVAKTLFETANHFDNNRLPELFGGFDIEDDVLIRYPEACSPQAWASGSLIWLLLKLMDCRQIDGKLIINKKALPAWLKEFEIIRTDI